jgi:potassium-transporting ATPase A subunit
MNVSGWTQLILFSVILLALTKPMGLYLVRVLDAEGRTFLDPALKPVERLIYRLAGIDPAREQDWKAYAKYFAIIPAMLVGIFPQIAPFNVMKLASPASAILSAVIFNAVIIIALIPLALKGIKFRPLGAAAVLRRNLLIYGLGGVIVPFISIKLIDLMIAALHLA